MKILSLRIIVQFSLIACLFLTVSLNVVLGNIDSLKAILSNSAMADTSKAKIYIKLAKETDENDTEIFIRYIDSAIYLSRTNPTLQITTLIEKGGFFAGKRQSKNAEESFELALQLASDNKNRKKYYEILLKLGQIQFDISNLVKAIEISNECLDYFISINDSLNIGHIYLLKGAISVQKSEVVQCIDYFEKALNIYEKLGIQKRIVPILINLGALHQNIREFETGLYYSKKALMEGKGIALYEGLILANIGTAYMELARIDSAEFYYAKVLDKAKESPSLWYALNGMGNVKREKEDYQTSYNYHQKALAFAKKNNLGSEYATTIGSIGRLFKHQGDFDKAYKFYQESLTGLDTIGDITQIRRTLRELILVKTKISGDNDLHEWYNRYIQIRDSTEQEANKIALNKLRYSFEARQREDSLRIYQNEAQLAKQQATINGYWNFGLFFSLIALGLLSFFYAKNYKLEKRNKLLAKVQNEQLTILNTTLTKELEEIKKPLLSISKILEKRVTLNNREHTSLVLKDILFLQSQENAVKFYTTKDITPWDWQPIKHYRNILPPTIFIQVHRSYLVNLYHVSSYTKKNLTMSNGKIIPIGNTRINEVYLKIKEYRQNS